MPGRLQRNDDPVCGRITPPGWADPPHHPISGSGSLHCRRRGRHLHSDKQLFRPQAYLVPELFICRLPRRIGSFAPQGGRFPASSDRMRIAAHPAVYAAGTRLVRRVFQAGVAMRGDWDLGAHYATALHSGASRVWLPTLPRASAGGARRPPSRLSMSPSAAVDICSRRGKDVRNYTSLAKNEAGKLACANVFGLCWSAVRSGP